MSLLGISYDDESSSDDEGKAVTATAAAPESKPIAGLMFNYAASDEDDSDSDDQPGSSGLGRLSQADGPIDIGPKTIESAVEVPAKKVVEPSLLRSMNLLPPEPTGQADPHVQAKIKLLLSKTTSFNFSLQDMKQFHNPSFLDRIVKDFSINRHSSNFIPEIFDPKAIASNEYYDAITREQDELRRQDLARPTSRQQGTAGKDKWSNLSTSMNAVKKFKNNAGVARKLTAQNIATSISVKPQAVPSNTRFQKGMDLAKQLSIATMNGMPLPSIKPQ